MIETVYKFTPTAEKLIERIVDDANCNLNHVVLTPGTGVPEHVSNSNVYLVLVAGAMTIQLGEQEAQVYPAGSIVNVPFRTKMKMTNAGENNLEFFIFKSPNPKDMPN